MAHILIVDDAADLRLLMRMALQSDGHSISDADGGVSGLAMLNHLTDVDIVVLDVQMPAVDGWEVLERMRRHPAHLETPVLMCTVKFSHDDLIRAWELGCDGYLNKPFDLHDLTELVAAIIGTDPAIRSSHRNNTLTALRAMDPGDQSGVGAAANARIPQPHQ